MILVAKASALRPTLGLSAYDRLFPNQDTLPAGGFGNLIALPLAKVPRHQGNTLFVNSQMEAFDDQWSYLAEIPRLSREELEKILARIAPLTSLTRSSASGSSFDNDFALQTDTAVLDLSHPRISSGMLSGEVTVRLDAQIHVPRSLPAAILAGLRRLATFPIRFFTKSCGCASQPLIPRGFSSPVNGIRTGSCCHGACWSHVFPSWRQPEHP